MLSIEDKPLTQGIYITSDLRDCWEGSVRWSLETLNGDVLTSGEERAQAAPLAVSHVRTLNFADRLTEDNRREVIFVAELWQGDRRLALQVATFVPTKHLSLTSPGVTANLRRDQSNLIVDLTSRSLARLLELSFHDADVSFSDN